MKLRLVLLAAFVAAFVFAPTAALATDANGNHDTYAWVVGFTTGTATAIAPDGSTITMSGHGTLMAGPGNTATGGGTYTLSADGSGTFVVTGIDSFVSYGPGTFAPGVFGGEAKLTITLSNGESGVLTVYCLQGNPPPSKMEGIAVILGQGGNFTKPDGGNTVFIHS